MPGTLRRQTVVLAREGHQGIVKTEVRLCSKAWWPCLDREAEVACRSYHTCQIVGLPAPPEPVKSTELPTEPWVDLTADLIEPLLLGEYFFVVVDYYGQYIEMKVMRTVPVQKIITALDEIFSRIGVTKVNQD